jgi:hypothetical protein
MKNTYTNQDIALASALYTAGYKFQGIENNKNGNCSFLFAYEASINDAIRLYYQNELKLSALALFNNYRNLKNLIHQSCTC